MVLATKPHLYVPERYSSRFSSNPFPLEGLVFYTDLWNVEQQGYCLSYDGDDKLANALADFRSADSSGAIEGWVRSSSTANYQTLFASSDTATSTSLLMLYINQTTGKLGLNEQNEAGTYNSLAGNTNVCDGKWHHWVLSSSGTAWTIILDGAAESLTVIYGTNCGDWFADIPTSRDNITIGCLSYPTNAFFAIGAIGFTRIYSRPMLQPEAQTNYQRGRKATASDITGLVFNLPTTEGTGNPVDTVGSLTMTRTGATWIESLIDRSVNALSLSNFGAIWGTTGRTFDGIDDTVVIDDVEPLDFATGNFSLGFWIKRATNWGDYGQLLGKRVAGNGYALNTAATLQSIYFSATASISGTLDFFDYRPAPVNGVWSQCWWVISRIGTTMTLTTYQNGALLGAQAQTVDGSLINTDSFILLYSSNIGVVIDFGEVWGYNRALTAAEIQRNYLATKWRYV